MLKKILKILIYILGAIILVIVFFLIYCNFPVKEIKDRTELGITFSSRYSEDIGLDWKENFIAILDDLKIRKIRVPVYWDLVEPVKDEYNFSDVDWQLEEAKKRNAEIILVVGQKVPRWPECFIPEWIENDDKKRKEELLELVSVVVNRYKNNLVIKYWQIENEPFLKFGICPAIDADLLDEEIKTVKGADSSREIIITDSGELSLWISAAKRADVFGTTMYRDIYKEGWGHYKYPIGPRFFQVKCWLIEKFTNQNKAIVIELQAEPWMPSWTVNNSLEEQLKFMNEKKIKENVEYAKQSGFSEIYLWGAEWWYWLKVKADYPVVWEEVKNSVEKNNSEAKVNLNLKEDAGAKVINKKTEEKSPAENNLSNNRDLKKEIPEKILIPVSFISQAPYAVWDEYHEEACEEAVLIMAAFYFQEKELNQEIAEKEIQDMIKFQIKEYGDYKDSGARQIVKLAEDFYGMKNLEIVYDFNQDRIKKELAKENPIIIPAAGQLLDNPYFTPPGPLYHNLILIGYEGNEIIVNDPGTKRGESYRYNPNILYNAIHDFSGDKNLIEQGRKAMIIVRK